MCSSTTKDRAVLPNRPACSRKSKFYRHSLWQILFSLLFLLSSNALISQRTVGDFSYSSIRGNILGTVPASCPDAESPGFGSANPDGDISEWDLTNDFFANMYEAGNPTKDLLSKAYLRYDCGTNTLCVLVIMEPGQPADMSATDAWMKVYDISNSTQVDGNSTSFAWLPNQAGWEGCFSLAEMAYAEVEIHVNSNGRTSSTGKRAQGYTPLCIKCPACPPAGQTCDDGDPTTENDVTDGQCGCAGTPCPTAGQTCDDGDPTTENDVTDGQCGCAGTPCPTAGQTCDDGDPTTENDVTDGQCGCAGTPCPTAGQTCDDGDPTTENDVTDGQCGCAGTPCPTAGQTCDDGDPTTENDVTDGQCGCAGTPCPTAGQTCDDGDPSTENDMTDGECGCAGTPCTAEGKHCDDYDCNTYDYYDPSICDCVFEPITPPSCDDYNDCTTDYYDSANCQCVNEPIDDLNCGDGTIDCEGQTEATYDPETERYTLYAEGCWHDCLQPDRDVHFYQELCGDGELIAHVVSITGSGHAGVVMREGLDPVARRVGAMTKLYSNSVRREYREEYGAPVHQMPAFRPGVEWFRMIRNGNQVKVYTSKRGNVWRLFYKVTYPNLASCLNVGLMAYSSSGSSEITAVFDNVQVIPAGSSFGSVEEVFIPGKLSAEDQVLVEYGQNDPRVRFEIAADQISSEKLAVYPNPAKEEAFVAIPQYEGTQQAVLVLYNSTGQEVLRRRVDTGISRTEMIPLSDLDAGVYVLRLMIDGKKDLSQRLVISK